MQEPHVRPSGAVRARERAAKEEGRAARAGAVALRHEKLATDAGPKTRQLHLDMAVIHRDIERRHRTAARLHAAHADRLAGGVAPRFMAAVAATIGAEHVGLSLVLENQAATVAVASDPIATAAQDLERTFREGPAHDVVASGDLVLAVDLTTPGRWPHFSPAVAELGVRAVVSAPLRARAGCLGALTVFTREDGPDPTELCRVADALVHSALLAPDSRDPLDLPLLADVEELAVVHQAGGMVAVQLGCAMDDAHAVLRARAFAENRTVTAIARDVVRRTLRLTES